MHIFYIFFLFLNFNINLFYNQNYNFIMIIIYINNNAFIIKCTLNILNNNTFTNTILIYTKVG